MCALTAIRLEFVQIIGVQNKFYTNNETLYVRFILRIKDKPILNKNEDIFLISSFLFNI